MLLLLRSLFLLVFVIFYSSYAFPGCQVSAIIIDNPCFGDDDGEIKLIPSGGTRPYTYSWGNPLAGVTDSFATDLEAGTYFVTITDFTGCIIDTFFVVEEPLPIMTSYSSTRPSNSIFDGSITVNASGGNGNYSYNWSNIGAGSNTIDNLAPGNYSVTITDGEGCKDTIEVILPASIAALETNIGGNDALCFKADDGYAFVDPAGGVAPYQWTWSTGSNDDTVFNLSPGIYKVTLTDNRNVSVVDSIEIQQPDSLEALFISTDLTCYKSHDGQLSAVLNGGTMPIANWNWEGPSGFLSTDPVSINGLKAGKYLLTVSDQNGCVLNDSTEIFQPDPLQPSVVSVTGESSPGAEDGSAVLAGAGGTAPYTFRWNVNGTTLNGETQNSLPAGTHPVLLIDSDGCDSLFSVTVPKLTNTARIKLINNNFSPGNPKLDLFVVDQNADTIIEVLDNISFLSYSEFFDIPAGVAIDLKASLAQSPPDISLSKLAWTFTPFQTGKTHVIVVNGNDPNSQFPCDVYDKAREQRASTSQDSTDILIYHGGKDMGRVNIIIEDQNSAQFEVPDITFRDYSSVGYITLSTLEDYQLFVKDFSNNTLFDFTLPISQLGLKGEAITMLISGVANGGYEEDFGIIGYTDSTGSIFRIFPNDTATGITSIGTENIVVFPNPFSNILVVNSEAAAEDNFRLVDLSGKIYQPEVITPSNGQTVLSVDNLPAGMYILEWRQKDTIHRTKVLKSE